MWRYTNLCFLVLSDLLFNMVFAHLSCLNSLNGTRSGPSSEVRFVLQC
jgi:hypothetical protein